MIKLNQIGDTIIEVMFAVAVIGVTIAGAYGIASRSLKAARQAQERGEALKLAEGQLESIKARSQGVTTGSGDLTDTTKVFCMDGSNRVNFTATGWAGTLKPIADDGLTDYEAACVKGLYHISTQVQNLGDDTDNRYAYTVAVRWFRVGSGPSDKDEVKIDYRMVVN